MIPLALISNDLTPSVLTLSTPHRTVGDIFSPADQHFHKMLNGRNAMAYLHWCNNFICLRNLSRHRAPVIRRILLELRVTAKSLLFYAHCNFHRQRVFTTLRGRPGRYNTEPVNRPVVILARNQYSLPKSALAPVSHRWNFKVACRKICFQITLIIKAFPVKTPTTTSPYLPIVAILCKLELKLYVCERDISVHLESMFRSM